MFFSFGKGSTQSRIMKELFPGLWAVNWGCPWSLVWRAGKVLSVKPFQPLSLGTWPRVTPISLSFAQCVVSACTDVFSECGSTAINFQHLQVPEEVPLVETLILEFVCCCQNLSMEEWGHRPVYWGAFTVISDGRGQAAVFHGYNSKLHRYKHQKYFLRGRRARYGMTYSWLTLTGKILWWGWALE